MSKIIDLDLTQEQIDKLISQLEGTEFLKIDERVFVDRTKCEEMLIGFAKEKMKEFYEWLQELKPDERTKREEYSEGGWGEIQLTIDELVEKFCHPDKVSGLNSLGSSHNNNQQGTDSGQ